MARNRILFLLWLLLWLAAWALGAGNVSGGILLGSLLLALGEVLLARRVRKRLSASLTAALSCRKGGQLPVTLTVTNTGLFTAPQVRAVVRCRNLLTGEQWQGGGLRRRVLRAAPLRQAGADGADPDGP